MESRAKFLGHPIHPMLIVYPVGLLSAAVLFDVLYLATGNETFAHVAFWSIVVGVVGGLAAALFGLLDWMAIPAGTRAKRIGLWHGGGNVVIVVLFALSALMRMNDPAYQPNILPFILALAGVALALVTAWLGGELVYRLRVGVDEGANLDASNSLKADTSNRLGSATSGPTLP